VRVINRITPYLAVLVLLFVTISTGCHYSEGKYSASKETDSAQLVNAEQNEEKEAILNSPATKEMQRGLEAFYERELGGNRHFNGGMLVARKGVVIFEKYNGYANFRLHQKINNHTSFQLASTSKTFTGMATLWLQQQGKLSINDPIQKYFPNFPYKGITLKMLLNHRSGLPNYLYCCDSLWPDRSRYMTNMDVINILTKYHPAPQYQPNTHFDYCNTNYCILGAVIEKVTGEKLGTFLSQIFFKPLGMKDTHVYTPRETMPPNQSLSYNYRDRQEANNPYDGVVGDKNVYSTPEDLLKWDQALYNGKLFTDSSLKAAYTPYSHERPGIRNYGLGWRMIVYPDGEKIIYHNGWWHGDNSVFYRFIKDTTTLIILSNKYDRAVYQVKPIWKILHENDGGVDNGED
jgi:CubicO group peptidase (beta-lactamase class C family)